MVDRNIHCSLCHSDENHAICGGGFLKGSARVPTRHLQSAWAPFPSHTMKLMWASACRQDIVCCGMTHLLGNTSFFSSKLISFHCGHEITIMGR